MSFKSKYKDLGPLHALLINACPPDPDSGTKSIPVLAEAMGLKSWTIYKWIKAGRIPPRQAMRVVDLSHGAVSLSDMTPFVFTD